MTLWNCWWNQFSLLSGNNNSSDQDKNTHVDLVAEQDGLFLVELKQWKSNDNILYAAMEIISYWIAFVRVRRLDSLPKQDESPWPASNRFHLRVMAPTSYFEAQPEGWSRLIEKIREAIPLVARNDLADHGELECDFDTLPLKIDKAHFIRFLSHNRSILLQENAERDSLKDGGALDVELR